MIARYAFIVLLAVCSAGCNRGRRPDVILITIDTLRADHLGTYGYREAISPTIDRFAAGATVFEHAVAQAPHTIPSLLQIMTSKYRHAMEIPPEDATLAEMLRSYGYQTAAVVDNALLEIHPTARGLMRGFNTFYRNGILDRDLAQQHWKTKTPADCVTAQAIRWLKRRDTSQPFFLWLHYFDPHDPYLPPFADDLEQLSRDSGSDFTGDIRNTFLFKEPKSEAARTLPEKDRLHLIALYDAEIRYLDQSLGDLLDFLERAGLYQRSMIVLAADHGESFGEHGIWMHGHSLHAAEVHVPMVIKFPAQTRSERVKTPVQAIDIVPTIVEVLQVPTPGLSLDGISVRQRQTEPAFAFWGNWKLVETSEWKLIQEDATTQLFRLETDPAEEHDISASEPAMVSMLSTAGAAKLANLEGSGQKLKSLSSATVEQLRSLGYLPK